MSIKATAEVRPAHSLDYSVVLTRTKETSGPALVTVTLPSGGVNAFVTVRLADLEAALAVMRAVTR